MICLHDALHFEHTGDNITGLDVGFVFKLFGVWHWNISTGNSCARSVQIIEGFALHDLKSMSVLVEENRDYLSNDFGADTALWPASFY